MSCTPQHPVFGYVWHTYSCAAQPTAPVLLETAHFLWAVHRRHKMNAWLKTIDAKHR